MFAILTQNSRGRLFFQPKNNFYEHLDKTGKSMPTWKRIYETHIFTKFTDFGKRILVEIIYVMLRCSKRIQSLPNEK